MVGLLSGSDGHESLHDANIVMDDFGQGGQVVGGAGGTADNLSELSYLLQLMPITNTGASAEGAEVMTLLALPFK